MKLWLAYVVYLLYENMESNGNLIKSINNGIMRLYPHCSRCAYFNCRGRSLQL